MINTYNQDQEQKLITHLSEDATKFINDGSMSSFTGFDSRFNEHGEEPPAKFILEEKVKKKVKILRAYCLKNKLDFKEMLLIFLTKEECKIFWSLGEIDIQERLREIAKKKEKESEGRYENEAIYKVNRFNNINLTI